MSDHSIHHPDLSYVLVTPAYNEADYITQTLEAVIAQQHLPTQWIIVSDGSTDNTDEIVKRYAKDHDFIRLLRQSRGDHRGHDYAAKVKAVKYGMAALDADYQFIGILDADISFGDDYYAQMLHQFQQHPKLGIAGGLLYEPNQKNVWEAQFLSTDWSVSGPIQFFRRECYEQIGGYLPLQNGEDAMAEVMSRMHGWQVRTFTDVLVKHHRPTYSQKGSAFYSRYWEGRMDYMNGNHPVFELMRSIIRLKEFPWILSGILMYVGYCSAWFSRQTVVIPESVRVYLQAEQLQRLKNKFLRK